jgi:apolipoprotein N-acyltransferase
MRRDLLMAASCAIGIGLAFPPLQLGFLAYWSVIPLLILLEKKTPAESFRWGYIAGFFLSVLTLYWIIWPTVPGAIATMLIHPLYYAVFAYAVTIARRAWSQGYLILVPFFWTAIEYVKSLGELGFPWVTLGYTQSYYLQIIQFAAVTSVYGVSFWVLCLNVVFLLMWKHRGERRWLIGCATALSVLFIAPYLYGLAVIPSPVKTDEPEGREVFHQNIANELRVAVVQGNVDPYLKWDKEFVEQNFVIYERLTRRCAAQKPQLIVWPETATPTWLLHDLEKLTRLRNFVKELDVSLLTGTPDYKFISERKYKTYNAAVLISPSRAEISKYAKMHLVPFGERVPWEDEFPWLQKWLARFEMGEGNFSPGEAIELFELSREPSSLANGTATLRLALLICFESFFPEQARDYIRRGADVLVVITNDGWFGPTMPYGHARMSIFRAIENRISVVRSANTGISMTIDPYGRVGSESSLNEEAVLIDAVPLRREASVFAKYGPVFSQSVVGVSVLSVLFAILESIRTRNTSKMHVRAGVS